MSRLRKLRKISAEGDITTFEIEWSAMAPVEWHTVQVQISGLGTPEAALVPQEFDPPLPVDVLARFADIIAAAASFNA